MGTSLYLDNNNERQYYNNFTTLNELMRNLGQKCSSTTSISMTLLSGENHVLYTKNDVQRVYRGKIMYQPTFFNLFGQSFFEALDRSQSLNDDLENIFSHMISTSYFYSQIITRKTRWLEQTVKPEARRLFLYEMLSEDEIKAKSDLKRWSEDQVIRSPQDPQDHQYLLSLCRVLTVYF